MIKRATERNLEIIRETINRILKREPNYVNKISQAKSVIALRNHVIHAYDSISDESIWSILINHLPKLAEEVDRLINNEV